MNGNYHSRHTKYESSERSQRNNKIPKQTEKTIEITNSMILETNKDSDESFENDCLDSNEFK